MNNIFDPFQREDESRNRIHGGLGLGLMLVQQIVDCHHGTIEIRNREHAVNGGFDLHIIMNNDGST